MLMDLFFLGVKISSPSTMVVSVVGCYDIGGSVGLYTFTVNTAHHSLHV